MNYADTEAIAADEIRTHEVMDSEAENTEDSVDMYVKFSKPYRFDDDTYDGLDMSCLEALTTRDLADIEKKFYRQGITSMTPENTVTYAKIVAQKASGLPIEFFEQLPLREMMKIKSRVVNFFYN
ncbi:MAG: phage tail assembly protein [Butyrivibrio sp.]|nr:phage tail assembly protein [Butyrivibrio sp.]